MGTSLLDTPVRRRGRERRLREEVERRGREKGMREEVERGG